jgi:RNA polymerase sigma factor (sigma-70 family)
MQFSDLIQKLDPLDFEGISQKLLLEMDQSNESIIFNFERSYSRSSGETDLVAIYRKEVSFIPRMDRKEELAFIMGVELLWRRLVAARIASGFNEDDVYRYPGIDDLNCSTCPPGRERFCLGCAPVDLKKRLRSNLRSRTQEFVAARNELLERHLFIVFRLLQRYRYSGVAAEDLVQEGNLSLFKAVQGFDFTRGVRFKTYAGYWILQAFLTSIYNQSRTVRVPAYIQKAMKKIRDASNGRMFSHADVNRLSKESGVSPDLIRTAISGNRYTLSLNRSINADGSPMMDLVEAENDSEDPDFSEEKKLSIHLADAVSRLSGREQVVLEMRFGLSGTSLHTLSEVGERLGVSLERVRQIQKAALEKIRSTAHLASSPRRAAAAPCVY